MPDANRTEPVPRDVNFPKTLRITIETAEEAFDAALDESEMGDDEQIDAVVSFSSAKGVRRLLTDRRLELLRSLMTDSAQSISDLADRLDRNYSTVHEGVEILAEYGIVRFRQEGQSKQPFVPYETIEFDVTIQAYPGGNDSGALA